MAANAVAGVKGFMSLPLIDRFWNKVEKTDTCWLWRGSTVTRGYGQLWQDGKLRLAHRISYEMHVGPVQSGLVLDHLCDNPNCVNPTHLRQTTQSLNVTRGKRRAAIAKAEGR